MRWLRDALAQRFPQLRFGYFNPAVRRLHPPRAPQALAHGAAS
jgi:hypothetical protein